VQAYILDSIAALASSSILLQMD